MLITRDVTKKSEDRTNLALVSKFRSKLNDLNAIKDITLRQLLQMQETASAMQVKVSELHDDLVDDLNDVKGDLSSRGVTGKQGVINEIQRLLDEAEDELEDISKGIDVTITCLNVCQTCNTGETPAPCDQSTPCNQSIPVCSTEQTCTSEAQQTLQCIYTGNVPACTDENQGTGTETHTCEACHGSTVTTSTETTVTCVQCDEDNCIGGSCDAVVGCDSSLGGDDQEDIGEISCGGTKDSVVCVYIGQQFTCWGSGNPPCSGNLDIVCSGTNSANDCSPDVGFVCSSTTDTINVDNGNQCESSLSISKCTDTGDSTTVYDWGDVYHQCTTDDYNGNCRPAVSINDDCGETYVTNECYDNKNFFSCSTAAIDSIDCSGKVNIKYCNGTVQSVGCDAGVKCNGEVQNPTYECGTGQQTERQEETTTTETTECTGGASTTPTTWEEEVPTGCVTAEIAGQETLSKCRDNGDGYTVAIDACGPGFTSCSNLGSCDYARFGSVVGCGTGQGCGTCNASNTCANQQTCSSGQSCSTCNTSCNTGCLSSCQGSCQSGDGCGSCNTTCQSTCQENCEGSCQSSCESQCQGTCDIICQACVYDACLSICQTGL